MQYQLPQVGCYGGAVFVPCHLPGFLGQGVQVVQLESRLPGKHILV
jgi:hypothetical protein